MGEGIGNGVSIDVRSAEESLSYARELVPMALVKAREFLSRWKMIVSKLEQIPSCLSDLSSHQKNGLSIELADLRLKEKYAGKLKMQSDLDALLGKLDLNLRDVRLLIKTGVLGEATLPELETAGRCRIKELFARLQIGHLEEKHKAVDTLVEVMKEDEKSVLSVIGQSNTVTVICSIAESGSCESWLVSEGFLPPLIRLVESGSTVGKEKATISLQRLSMNEETARAIVGHDSVLQTAAASTLKNISAVPEVRQILAEEGIIKVMINLLDCGILLGSKEHAPKPAVAALRNLVSLVSTDVLMSHDFLPRLVYVLKSGSLGAQKAAASTICRVCTSSEMKKLVGESGCITLLVRMLEAKSNSAREVAAQALSSLVTVSHNCREFKKDDEIVPNLVQLLDPSPQNTAKKYAVSCLSSLSSSKKCKKLMISYGSIEYLKKLSEMETPGAKKLLERLERGKLRSLFVRK
ncbi:hypothetical protein ES288_D12G125600v1 [Gossypium darwinii]|uniref:DUF7032 domain-containing protein n=1 Tax=Gossypium darwinii TaxID=34276 RepID=A0A5D2AA87_GOSDA|nr:hypothetical protein ES288_D12G125600v1 [Gossypium darwinii]